MYWTKLTKLHLWTWRNKVNSFVNQIIDKDWDIKKVNFARIGTDAVVAGIKGILSFIAGCWTGAAGCGIFRKELLRVC